MGVRNAPSIDILQYRREDESSEEFDHGCSHYRISSSAVGWW